jgi:hypothetical protein
MRARAVRPEPECPGLEHRVCLGWGGGLCLAGAVGTRANGSTPPLAPEHVEPLPDCTDHASAHTFFSEKNGFF